MHDRFNLERFVEAQEPVFDQVRSELREGSKRSHWMWFVFPQIQGLGFSSISRRFAISSLDEASAYSRHPILGPRLTECTALVNRVEGKTIHQVFGSPDDMKFHSSMTLFLQAAPENPVFLEALQKFFKGERDPLTLARL